MRTLKLAGIAAAGLVALTACSNVQGAAMYVGDERIPEETVDAYVDEQVTGFVDQGAVMADIDFSKPRDSAVTCVMLAELGQELELAEPDTSAATNDFEAVCLEAQSYLGELAQTVEPRDLTDDDLARLREAGFPFDQLPPEHQADLMRRAGIAAVLTEYIEEYDVRVNPRYGVESFSLAPEGLENMLEVEIPQS